MTVPPLELSNSYATPAAVPETLKAVHKAAVGKAILVGEHAVVYGARAVAMPVPSLTMSIRLQLTERRNAHGEPDVRISLGGRAVTEHLGGVVKEARELLGLSPFAMDLEGQSTVPIGAGLGSSASLCIVILKALAAAKNVTLAPAQLAALGNTLERRFHGNPSGLDTAVVAAERVTFFRKGEAPTLLTVRSPWRFALLDSGVRSSTATMIQVAAPYFQGEHGARRIARFDTLADDVANGLAASSVDTVAAAMNEAGRHLADAGVVSGPLAELAELALRRGAKAAKSTGAGGGGCVLALLDPARADAHLDLLRESLGRNRVYGVEL